MSSNVYINKIQNLINEVKETQLETINKVAELFVEKIKQDKVIHIFGTGHSHMIAIEMFVRAGGLANINAMLDATITTSAGARKGSYMEKLSGLAEIIWNGYNIDKDDIMIIISNSGRNSVPVEMALKAKEEGLTLIAITSMNHTKNCESRHPSGKRLFEIADIVLDNCVPVGDSLMDYDGVKSGPGSTISGSLIVDSIVAQTLTLLNKERIQLPIFTSQNVNGFNNDNLYDKYENRIKHM